MLVVRSIKTLITLEITDGDRTRVVHVNHLQPRIQPQTVNKNPVVPIPPPGIRSAQVEHMFGSRIHQELNIDIPNVNDTLQLAMVMLAIEA